MVKMVIATEEGKSRELVFGITGLDDGEEALEGSWLGSSCYRERNRRTSRGYLHD